MSTTRWTLFVHCRIIYLKLAAGLEGSLATIQPFLSPVKRGPFCQGRLGGRYPAVTASFNLFYGAAGFPIQVGSTTPEHMNIGYARVSTEEQNLNLQIDALNRAGCDIVFWDEGVSAVATVRPQFSAAIDMLKPGDRLTIWKMDRAFRSLLDALQVLDRLEVQGVSFVSLTDAIDTKTPMGRFAYQIINAFGELERALIAERTRAGMQAAKERGVIIGRPPKLSQEDVAWARQEIITNHRTPDELATALDISPRTLARRLAEVS